jgi:hypothetical protein
VIDQRRIEERAESRAWTGEESWFSSVLIMNFSRLYDTLTTFCVHCPCGLAFLGVVWHMVKEDVFRC